MRLGQGWRHGIVEGARLLVERQALAGEHPDAGRDRGELPLQVVAAQPLHLSRRLRDGVDRAGERFRLRRELASGAPCAIRACCFHSGGP